MFQNELRQIASVLLLAPLLLMSCSTAPEVAPTDAGHDIADKLVAGDEVAAQASFEELAGSERHREVVFSILYTRSRDRYDQRDYPAAALVLRFLVEQYPKARAPREALLYALFLERAQAGKPLPRTTVAEMDRLLAGINKAGDSSPVWLDLVSVQVAIDSGRIAPARASFARFRRGWNGRPAALKPYVDDIDRFLTTNSEDQK